MSNLQICEINLQTGKEILRDFSPEELEIAAADKAAKDKEIADENAKIEARLALLAKLGLTEEEAKLLLG